MSFYRIPRSMFSGVAKMPMHLGRSSRFALLSSSKATPTSKLQRKRSDAASTTGKSSLGQSYISQLKEQARADVKAGVSLEDGRKRAVESSPLLKYLSPSSSSQFQKATNAIYEEAYRVAKAELSGEKSENSGKATFDVKA